MKRDSLKRELYAEFLGTFVLIVFGAGSVAQVLLSKQQNGSYFSINFSWGLAVTMAIYVAGGVSGAHLNPAVTLALAWRRGFAWSKVPAYWLAQTLGAFAGAATVFLVYYEAFDAYDGGTRMILGEKGTAGIFSTYPQPFLSVFGGLVDQVFGTAILVLIILAIGDTRNQAAGPLGPIVVGFLVTLIGMTFGFNSGYAINPARDLGPRLFTAVAGWGPEVFRAGHYWCWIPIIGPLTGGPLGAYLYDAFIGKHFPDDQEKGT
ncbi:MAG TPA: MIP family channel protein [Blastocatellia bacterium]|nr:MIP family channel protein [Blastocatellia bacterium]